MTSKQLHNAIPAWLLITITVVIAVFFVSCVSYVFFQSRYDGRVYPGVSVAGVQVGGKNPAEARSAIAAKVEEISEGIPVRAAGKEVVMTPETSSLNPDLAVPLVNFDIEQTLASAYGIGRQKAMLGNIVDQFHALIAGITVPLTIASEREQVVAELQRNFSELEQPPVNARLVLDKDGSAIVEPEADGKLFNYESAATRLLAQFSIADRTPIEMQASAAKAEIRRADVNDIDSQVTKLLETPPVMLTYENKAWKLDKAKLISWAGLVKSDNEVRVGLDRERIKKFLAETIEPAIGQPVTEAKLNIEGGRVTVWQAGQDGLSVDLDATADAIAAWPKEPWNEVVVSVKEVRNTVTDQSAEELGLKEIIGTGTSQFSGSPANRRHNIKVGAMALNGLLIKPGEEFSLLKALGSIDAKSGYLPELVIKENRTIPEYGGGLCQIGTTVFRATFNSGLPVTQRRNHSYRVSYYEPAGTDATIYDPAPDYRFVNDTGHYILIQARLGANELSFDFWGTRDGRDIKVTKPVIYNIVQPAPTKIVETTDLPEGQKRCTEKAHAGADAYFDYTVTYANGDIKNKRFSSHYVPWQAVCLVGVKKPTPTSSNPATPSSTVSSTAAPATN